MNDIKVEQEKYLAKNFPGMFRDLYGDPRDTCMAFGVATGPGWFEIIKSACEKIAKVIEKHPEQSGFRFAQIKEKFGGLRLYYSGTFPSAGKLEIDEILESAEQEAYKTCEECGAKDDVTTDGPGWILTLCCKCRKDRDSQREQRKNEPLNLKKVDEDFANRMAEVRAVME